MTISASRGKNVKTVKQVQRRGRVVRGIGGAIATVAVSAGSLAGGVTSASEETAGSTAPDPADPFATRDAATGEPLLIGYATTGQTEATDYRHEADATDAVVAYINEYLGGIGGRPLELLMCEDGRAEARISTCVNEMLAAEVPMVVTPSTANSALYAKSFSEAGIPWLLDQASEPSTLTTEGVYVLTYSPAATVTAPARYMAANGLESIAYIAIDSPGLVDALTERGEAEFAALGLEIAVLGVAPGTADMTPQVAAALQGHPDTVMVVGQPAFCISAITALRTTNFDGTTLVIPNCVDESTHESVPGGLGGLLQLGFMTTDPADPDVMLREAIYDEYSPGLVRDSLTDQAFQTFMALHSVLDTITGEVTSETVHQAFTEMPSMPLPLGGGIQFQCNGEQVPQLVTVCGNEGLSNTFDDEGQGVGFEVLDLSPTG